VDANVAPVISNSYGSCEIDIPVSFLEPVAQQANAQGITIFSASGDSGAAGCDDLDASPYYATLGQVVTFPANLPEITGVGGTLFNEGNGNYWAPENSANYGSALSYIPEVAWNETAIQYGIAASAGGVSALVSKPSWQAGPGVPNDKARDVPDVAMAAAFLHDAYYITYQGELFAVGGTSASSPSLAGVIAILNQYEVTNSFQQQAGLGNINPQLYRLAQSAPNAFHDIISGNNIVSCAQGTSDCLTGNYGYSTGQGYDPVTGLGSIDANNLVTQWNMATSAVTVTMTVSPARATVNDNVQLTAAVVAVTGTAIPTGTVSFVAAGVALGTAALTHINGVPLASVSFPAWILGPGSGSVDAVYSGDATFSSGSASVPLRISNPVGASAIEVSLSANPVYAAPPDAQGLSWQTVVSLTEVAGVPSTLTGFTINGQAQSLAQFFPSTSIPANGKLTASIVLRNLAVPLTSVFGFTGIDSAGNTWTRQLPVSFLGPQVFQNFNLSANPLTMTQNTVQTAPCQWSQLITLDETGGFAFQVVGLVTGSIDISTQIPSIFGTTRLAPYGSIQGTLCWNGITAPASNAVFIELTDQSGDLFSTQLTVSFAGQGSNPTALSATPSSLALQQVVLSTSASSSLAVGLTDKTQSWTASVYPGNRTTSWLTLSQYSGTGPAQITLTASGTGFQPGVYRAKIVLQSANTVPQYVEVPVMFLFGASGGSAITGATNAESYQVVASPGMIMAVFGSQLSNSVQQASTQPLPYTMGGVAATINGIAAPLYYASAGQLDIQVPYEAGAGPAVLGVNNNGQITGYQFQIAPSAPGIVTDGNGYVNPDTSVAAGSIGVLYVTGTGDVNPPLRTGFAPSSATPVASLPKPLLPFSVTVGGVPAFLQFVGLTPGVIGLTQVNFIVPAAVAPGTQPVAVTVNGVSSPPVNLTVAASQ
jgi:uncharacterized protein (TIGR03437 family)